MSDFKIPVWALYILYILPFIGYILLVLPFIDQLPMHEEVIHLVLTDSWKTTLQCYAHPPLYVIVAKLARDILGNTYKSLYAIGILSLILDIYLIYRILDILISNNSLLPKFKYLFSGMWLFVLMPVVVHGSLLLEMENTVLTPLCLLAILYYIKNEGRLKTVKFYMSVGLLFGFAMWAKFFATPLLLIGAIFLYEWNRYKNFILAIKNFVIILISALVFFVPTYLIYSYIFLPKLNTFTFLIFNKTKEGVPIFLSGKFLIPVLTKLMAFTFWFSPFFITLFIYLLIKMVRSWEKFTKERFFLWSIASILLFYLFAHPYPFAELKYFFPMFPLIAMLAVILIVANKIKFPPYQYLFLIPALTLLFFIVLGDPLYQTIYYYRSQMMTKVLSYFALYAVVTIALATIVYFILSRAMMRHEDALCSSLIYLTIAAWLSLFLSQAIGQYQTRVQYGETGAKETISYINSGIPNNSKVIIPGDISYYKDIKFSKEDSISIVNSELSKFESSPLEWDWIIDRKINILRLPSSSLKLLSEHFKLEREIGSYQIYRRKM